MYLKSLLQAEEVDAYVAEATKITFPAGQLMDNGAAPSVVVTVVTGTVTAAGHTYTVISCEWDLLCRVVEVSGHV